MTTATISNIRAFGTSGSFLKTIGTEFLSVAAMTILGVFCAGLLIDGTDLGLQFMVRCLEWFWPVLLSISFSGFMFRFEGNRSEAISDMDARIIYWTAYMSFAAMFALNIGLLAYSNNPALRSMHIFSGN